MKTTMRPAVSMIELVFSIVIIGLSVMTIPVMLTQSSESTLVSAQQEAILAGSTKLGNIVSHAWDINQTDSERNGGYAKVVSVPTGHMALRNPRVGHLAGDKRRRFYADASQASINANGSMHIDGYIGNETLVNASGSGDYLMEYNSTTDVCFISDTPNGGNYGLADVNITMPIGCPNPAINPTNIKFINVFVTSPDDADIQLRMVAFLSNIGQTELLKREIYED
jgi:hypothetical protein